MIKLSTSALKKITDAAVQAYPHECCGLLAGRRYSDASSSVSCVVASPNVAAGKTHDSFEVDPQVRFDLMRKLDDAGSGEEIIGHYHSHPNHPAQPSARDLAMAYEPDLIWVIVAVQNGQATETTAHVLEADGSQFQQIPLSIIDNPSSTESDTP
jgi:proteasome lid subunit RPN8/RPN11